MDPHGAVDFPLRRAENQDQSEAMDALIEGDARWVEDEFSKALTDQRQAQEASEAKAEYGHRISTDLVPAALQEQAAFPYDSGSDFIQNLRNEDGAKSVDAAFSAVNRHTSPLRNSDVRLFSHEVTYLPWPAPADAVHAYEPVAAWVAAQVPHPARSRSLPREIPHPRARLPDQLPWPE